MPGSICLSARSFRATAVGQWCVHLGWAPSFKMKCCLIQSERPRSQNGISARRVASAGGSGPSVELRLFAGRGPRPPFGSSPSPDRSGNSWSGRRMPDSVNDSRSRSSPLRSGFYSSLSFGPFREVACRAGMRNCDRPGSPGEEATIGVLHHRLRIRRRGQSGARRRSSRARRAHARSSRRFRVRARGTCRLSLQART